METLSASLKYLLFMSLIIVLLFGNTQNSMEVSVLVGLLVFWLFTEVLKATITFIVLFKKYNDIYFND